jgi:hypothetical protein
VPIPVGHRIEVRVFVRDSGRKKGEPSFDEPFLIDLDTGVTFGTDWHVRRLDGYRPGTVQDLPVAPRQELAVHSVWRGTVTAARVTTVGSGDSLFQQSTLVIAPSP